MAWSLLLVVPVDLLGNKTTLWKRCQFISIVVHRLFLEWYIDGITRFVFCWRMQADVWFVFRVQSGLDIRSTDSLKEKGFKVYSATGRKRVVHKRYKMKLEKTFLLFPGYLFVAMNDQSNWMVANRCTGVIGALGFDGLPSPLPAGQVELMQALQMSGEFDDLKSGYDLSDFPLGSKVEVTKGVFKGLVASIHSFKGQNKVRAVMDWFSSTSVVELPVGSFKLAT